jgi:hypothetical protein
MRAIPYTGEVITPYWNFTSVIQRPAAIGDVDNDGVNEMITTKGEYYHSMVLGTAPPKAFAWFPGETFSDMPSLADITGDGKLEIAAPTMGGNLYLLTHDGATYSLAWPQAISPGIPLTSVVFADILATSEPELIVADVNGNVHVRAYTGASASAYPKPTGAPLIYTPPIVTAVHDDFPAQIATGVRIGTDGIGHSWSNFGVPSPGWPRNFPGGVEETFAAGDIDNDGSNEIVVLGVDFVSVYDVNTPPSLVPTRHWPMNAHDAQRTGCVCLDTASDIDDSSPVFARTSLTARPNPFNPVTTIEYEVARAGEVYLEVFDVAGRRVATLIAGEHRDAGRHSIAYAADGASGVYFARLRAAGTEVTRKLVLLK